MSALGFSLGFGFGSGAGAGDGHGVGAFLGRIAGRDARLVWPGVVAVGCKVLTIEEWATAWRDIAEEEGVDVDEADVQDMITAAKAASEGEWTIA